MLTLVLAEAELELVPKEIANHRQVWASAQDARKTASAMLLDSSLHHAAMRGLPEFERRGRPDLVHFFLLTALESRAGQAGHLRTVVHTRNDEWITVDPTTRLMRNYNRFCSLMEQLLKIGGVPPERPLLSLQREKKLDEGLAALGGERLLWLDETAAFTPPAKLFSQADADRNVVAVIGGFPNGAFHSQPPRGAERIGLGKDQLNVWTVAAELSVAYARIFDPSE